MMQKHKSKLMNALIAGIASMFTIGILAYLSTFHISTMILIVSFGATMVLLYGYPNNTFAHPKNIFFGHLITALTGVVICSTFSGPLYLLTAISVGLGIFFMIALDVVHPPAGGNPIAVSLSNYSYDFLLESIIPGLLVIISLGYIINNFILNRKYPM